MAKLPVSLLFLFVCGPLAGQWQDFVPGAPLTGVEASASRLGYKKTEEKKTTYTREFFQSMVEAAFNEPLPRDLIPGDLVGRTSVRSTWTASKIPEGETKPRIWVYLQGQFLDGNLVSSLFTWPRLDNFDDLVKEFKAAHPGARILSEGPQKFTALLAAGVHWDLTRRVNDSLTTVTLLVEAPEAQTFGNRLAEFKAQLRAEIKRRALDDPAEP